MKSQSYTIKWKHHQKPITGKAHTECQIIDTDSETVLAGGIATLSEKDQYDKNIGRKVSLSEAMDNLSLSKEQRAKIWEDYRMMTPQHRWGD